MANITSHINHLRTFLWILIHAWICAYTLPLAAQNTQEERVKVLERLNQEDAEWEKNNPEIQQSRQLPANLEQITLPPLSVFLSAIDENASVKQAQAQVDEAQYDYLIQKKDWMNYFRISGMYSYGRYNVLSNNSDEFTPMYQTTMSSAQHNFNIGGNITFSLGDILSRPLKLKKYKSIIDQRQYAKEEVREERRLKILDAYNAVTAELSTIKAKAESVALYNAQMKISENNFIQGSIDIISLSLERGRRSGAVVTYEQARISLHNAILMLEMLTNIKIIKD
ncbi:MAG: TolC family protein [Bacteroides sp.]